MGKLHIVPALCLFVFASFCAAEPQLPSIAQSLSSTEKHQLEREARLVVDLVQNYHESGRFFREIENREILSRFINELDPQGGYLTKDDIAFIQQRFGRTLKSVYLLKGDLQPAFELFDLFSKRVTDRTLWIEKRLDQSFDFSKDEVFTVEPSATATNDGSSDQRWELRLKEEVLSEILAGRTEVAAGNEVAKRYAKLRRHFATLDALAVREYFFDGLLRAFDPHSGYFSADSAKEFAAEMAGGMAGAGLALKKEDGLCVVSALLPGGPAELTTELWPGDIVDAFGEADGPWIEAKSKRLREIIAFIRGKPGTQLRIAYHRPDENKRLETTLQRALVVSIAERARGAIFEVPGIAGVRHIGWIDLPMFYATQDDPTAPSATRDVADLLGQMRKQGLDGVVLDLRNNGGGALPEALAMSGLFIPRGLVMLSRGLDGKIIEHNATESADLYPGPLAILTSERSASASEIFTGAMKFHHRAIVVGGKTTFGKGSVQNYIDLAKTSPDQSNNRALWGTLRLTAQRFYLPDGKAVQHNGVASDIVLPLVDQPDFKREEVMPHALPAEPITAPVDAVAASGIQCIVTDLLRAALQNKTAENLKTLPEWSLWTREETLVGKLTTAKTHILQMKARQREWSTDKAQLESYRNERRVLAGTSAFPVRSVEIAAVQTAIDAHRAHLGALTGGNGSSSLNHLDRGAFITRTTENLLRQIWLDQINFNRSSGDADVLANVFAQASGVPATAAEFGVVLESIALLDQKNDAAVTACFAEHLKFANTDRAALVKGIDAVILRIVELDGDLCAPRPRLDIPLREALRTAAVWADFSSAPEAKPN